MISSFNRLQNFIINHQNFRIKMTPVSSRFCQNIMKFIEIPEIIDIGSESV